MENIKNGKPTYDHSQTGWLIINMFLPIILVVVLAFINQWGTHPIPLYGLVILLAVFLLVLSLFYKQRVQVDDSGIHVIYGAGLIHIRIKPERVEAARIVRSPWYYGLGIRFTPRGMLYSIQGLDAVELEYVQGTRKQVRIGSDDCRNLKRAIETRYQVPVADDNPQVNG